MEGQRVPGLIEEIQRSALDHGEPVVSLLRKMKLASAKLKLGELERWVDQELNGYTSKVPEYRILYGQPAAWNPINGWIPVQASAQWMELLSRAVIAQGIGGIADMISRPTDGYLHLPLPPENVEIFNQVSNFQTAKLSVQLSRGHIVGILDRVRNMVLDWAIEMERQGVAGEGYSFNAEEKAQAREVMTTITIGSIGNLAGNLGTGNKSGNITSTTTINDASIFETLASAIATQVHNVNEQQRLMATVQRMEQAQTDKSAFAVAYGDFVSSAANHMSVVAPFLPALLPFLA
jgi:hypothetical protein